MARDLKTIIEIAGDIDPQIAKRLTETQAKLDKIDAAMKAAATATDKLSDKIGEQGEELEKAKKAYMDYILSGEKSSKKAKELKNRIKQLSGELKGNKAKMDAAEQAANNLAGELDGVGDAARDSKDGLSIMDVALGNLAAKGIATLASKAADAAQSIYGLAESTREYREDMGKLETAWESAGKSTELATDMYKQFYSVLGEEDRSVEAVTHLAKFVDTEKDMQKWTNIATGVWGTFGDSLPIEGLTEAANETAKVAKVTGVLADALTWVGINEDTVNASLEKMSSEQERAAYITSLLNTAYSEAADNYRENNASIIEARLAQSDYTDSMAELGEKIEPVTTAVQEGLNKILEKALELADRVDFTAIATEVGELTDKVINLAENGIGWLKENADWLIPVVAGLTGAFAAYKVISIATSIAEAVKTAMIATGTTTITAATVATWSLNTALGVLLSPVTLVVAAIGALIAVGVALYRNWDTVKMYAAQLGEFLSGVWTSISEAVGGFLTGIKDGFLDAFTSLANIIKGPINAVIGIVNGAINGINAIGFDIPDWVPIIGGQKFRLDIPTLPLLASGGFTDGVSIAGEAGTEAVISYDPAYREQNLAYWAEAGRMLGADASDFFLAGDSGGAYYDMGGVSFSPNIVVHGNADKESVMEAIEEEYPEFLDMLEKWLSERGKPVYA